MNQLIAGDLVVCIDNSDLEGSLTVGQTYFVVGDEGPSGLCRVQSDDDGEEDLYFAWRFVRAPFIEVDGVKYTKGEVENIIRDFLKGAYRE